jgi:hypothetical protein
MLWAKTFEGADLGRIDNAIDALSDLKRSLEGKALESRREPVDATPAADVEPPQNGEIDPEFVKALQSYAEEVRQETELLTIRRAV